MVKKELSSHNKQRTFLRDCFLMCDFITQSSTLTFLELFSNTVVVDSAKLYVGVHWGLRWKRNIFRSKQERSLLRNYIAMCECNSQSYTFLFSDQFVSTVLWKSAITYFIAQWILQWQKIYPQIKTGKKPSEKLHFHVWMQLTEFHVSLQWSVC